MGIRGRGLYFFIFRSKEAGTSLSRKRGGHGESVGEEEREMRGRETRLA